MLILVQAVVHCTQSHDTPLTHMAFLEACRRGDSKTVADILQSPARGPRIRRLLAHGQHSYAPLHAACRAGHDNVVEVLLSTPHAHVDASAVDGFGQTALHVASGCGAAAVVEVLLNTCVARATQGVEVNTPDYAGLTPFHHACRAGHMHVAKRLARCPGVDISTPDCNGRTPLHTAARRGHVDVLAWLAGLSEVDVAAASTHEWSPFRAACDRGHVGVVRRYVDARVPGNAGRTAMYEAASAGNRAAVMYLLGHPQAGDTVQQPTLDGRTPLYAASRFGRTAVVREILADGRADPAVTDAFGWAPLSIAAAKGHLHVVRLLVADERVDITSCTGTVDGIPATPLEIACTAARLDPALLAALAGPRSRAVSHPRRRVSTARPLPPVAAWLHRTALRWRRRRCLLLLRLLVAARRGCASAALAGA